MLHGSPSVDFDHILVLPTIPFCGCGAFAAVPSIKLAAESRPLIRSGIVRCCADVILWRFVTSELDYYWWTLQNRFNFNFNARRTASSFSFQSKRRRVRPPRFVKIVCKNVKKKQQKHFHPRKMRLNPCHWTTRSSLVTTDSSRRFQFPMLITWVTTESSSCAAQYL